MSRIVRVVGDGRPEWGRVDGDEIVHLPEGPFGVEPRLGRSLGRLAEEGLVGGILQWSFYFVIFRAFMKKLKAGVWSRWFDRDVLILLGAILVTYMVGGMVIDYRYFDLINVIFYLLAGIIYGYDPGKNSGGEPANQQGRDLTLLPRIQA